MTETDFRARIAQMRKAIQQGRYCPRCDAHNPAMLNIDGRYHCVGCLRPMFSTRDDREADYDLNAAGN